MLADLLATWVNHYQRTHSLQLDAHSFSKIPNHEALQKLRQKWGNRTISIQTLENKLSKLANEFGINIIRGKQVNPDTIATLFPNTKVFIGADGARSAVRNTVFGDQFRFHSNLQYVVQIQYVVQPNEPIKKHSKAKSLSEIYRMQKFAEHIVSQSTRLLPNGNKEVTLRVFIDKNTYQQMNDASFKHPYYFETDINRIPIKLKNLLKKWWGARCVFHDENIVRDANNKMTVIALNSYAAKTLVKQDKKGRTWVLVGDAAAAFPFFRAINTGMLMGSVLAKAVAKGIHYEKKSFDPSFLKSYSHYASFRIQLERIKAFIKSFFVNCYSCFLKISNRLFWQINKIPFKQKKEIEKIGNQIFSKVAS